MGYAKELIKLLKDRVAFLDGAMGTMLMKHGMPAGVSVEGWAAEHPEVLTDIHSAFIDAGSDLILSCTFGGSALSLGSDAVRLNTTLADIAIRAAGSRAIPAASVGPSSKLIYPVGEISWMEVYDSFCVQAAALSAAGMEVFFLETFSDPRQLKAAVLAFRDTCPDSFISAHLTFADNGRTGSGTSPTALSVLCEQLPVNAAGANCSTGPSGLLPVITELCRTSTKLVTVEPNAGLPDSRGNYAMSPEAFADATEEMAWAGASIIGGCCGTTPEHIKALRTAVGIRKAEKREPEPVRAFSSVDTIVPIGSAMLKIGESVNPTGRKELKKAIRAGDHDFVISMARAQEEADLFDINMGLERLVPDGLITRVFAGLCTGAPLSADISSPDNIELAFREIGGIGLLNSMLSTEQHIAERVPVLLRHGGYTVLLPIDEKGLPDSPEGKLKVLRKGLRILNEHGFPCSRVLADPIVKAVATGADPWNTVSTMKLFSDLGLLTVAGVSNVSHGLPHRSALNAAFLSILASQGLDAGIVNVHDRHTSSITAGAAVLSGRVDPAEIPIPAMDDDEGEEDSFSILRKALIRGDGSLAERTGILLLKQGTDAREIITECLAPAMDRLGNLYAAKKLFLPHLIAGAEAARVLMKVLEPAIASDEAESPGTVVLATVRGDIHDIGKNLVSLFLSNAGYKVIDLGKDIHSESIVNAAEENNADAIALSALMSTTASRMEEVVSLLKKKGLNIPVIVGGAVVTEEFAGEIGAYYSRDAYSAVETISKVIS
ncbi:hypothetical protein CSA37_04225 [Candidatus Fermentibacteria bacterium]|nr:MAG: hypothetical protein CSA37_04225 [Candidatus Fermentibacteria bacterium]